MKRMIIALLVFGGFELKAQEPTSEPQESSADASTSFGDVGSFYGPLSPYGEWLEMDAGFYAWRPSHVRYGWRPYLNGHWAWTDYGWYWVSDEPFGWAVFHYGRWYNDDSYGWIWVPDRTWGPAWVEWRYNDDYLGWAPLPPYASFSFNIGIRFTKHWFAPYHYWNFVHYRHFTSRYLAREVFPLEYARRLIGSTRSTGRYEFDNGRIINRGIERGIVERRSGNTRIDRIDVRESGTMGERIVRDRNQERIEVYRPERSSLGRTPVRIEAHRVERGTSLDVQRIERSPWENSRFTNPKENERAPGVRKEESRPTPERVQRPEPRRREEPVERPRIERRIELPQGPTVEQRGVNRSNENRAPAIRQAQTQQHERQVTAPDRTQRETRRESVAPRTRDEQHKSPTIQRNESPRGNEQGHREGGRKRG